MLIFLKILGGGESQGTPSPLNETLNCVFYILEVVYWLCLSKAGCPGDSGDHTVVAHLSGSSPQLHHTGEVDYASSRMEGTNTTTKAVATATTITTTATTATNSWIRKVRQTLNKILLYNHSYVHVHVIPYGQKYCQELNLAVGPQIPIAKY